MDHSIPIPLKKKKLDVFDVVKEALSILNTYINFFIFALIISTPLFCFLIYYESFLLKILVQISESILALASPHKDYYFDYFNHVPLEILLIPRGLNQEFGLKLIQLSLLYLIPLQLLELFTTVITVDLASKIYTTQERIKTLKEMLHKTVSRAKFKTTFITFVYVLLLSTSTFLGLIWLVINYCIFWKSFYVLFGVIYGAAFLALLPKYLEWSAQWNMSVVISILEEDVYGVEALTLSAYFNRGSEKRGLILMLVFFVWGFVLRLAGFFFRCYDGGNGIVVEVFLYCLGNVIKWVACMVYYYDSKRILEKKVDEEVGIVVRAVDG